MEAWRFGFADEPSVHKFQPTDADLVSLYLLPRAIGYPNPYAHAIIDDDPCSCPPWELLRRHGHAGSDQAFFFGPPRPGPPGARAARAVAAGEDGVGGVWDGQKSDRFDLVLLRGAGAGAGAARLKVTFRRHSLSYYHAGGDGKTSGWVMHDYQIVEPPHLSATVLYRVKITDRRRKKEEKEEKQQRRQADAAAAGEQEDVVVPPPPGPDQPGPSNYYDYEPDPELPAVGGEENNGGDVGETGGYGYYAGDGNDFLYEGYGDYFDQGDGSGGGGGGGCVFAAAGDGDDDYANGGFVMSDTAGGYSDNYLNHDSGGDGSGGDCFDQGDDGSGGDCFFAAAGDGGDDYASGGFVMPDTAGGYCADGSDDYLNHDYGGDGSGGDYGFYGGDTSGYEHPDGGNGGSDDS